MVRHAICVLFRPTYVQLGLDHGSGKATRALEHARCQTTGTQPALCELYTVILFVGRETGLCRIVATRLDEGVIQNVQ